MAKQVANQTAFAASYNDPVRSVNPYTPTELVTGAQTSHVPIVGVVVLAVVVLVLEHLRRRRGGRK